MKFKPWIGALTLFAACVNANLEEPGAGDAQTAQQQQQQLEQGPCPVEPICSAFHTGGEGKVAVSIDPEHKFALVKSNGLAGHAMGPFGMSPYKPAAQDYTFRIPLTPTQDGGKATPKGPIAVAFDGVPFFGPRDPQPLGSCTGNSGLLADDRTDSFGGAATPEGNYYYFAGQFLAHAAALGITHTTSAHSSLLGYAFDGYPIYGPYGYKKRDDAGSGIKLLRSCYQLKAARTCCTDPGVCGTTATSHGKPLVLGSFLEDYEFSQASHDAGACDLNEFNMRLEKTPGYPDGTWAYIITVDAAGAPQFPYVLGPNYFGEAPERPQ